MKKWFYEFTWFIGILIGIFAVVGLFGVNGLRALFFIGMYILYTRAKLLAR